LCNRHPQERGDRAPCSRVRQRRKPIDGWLPSPTRSDADRRSGDCAPAISQRCLTRLRPEEWFSMERARWTNCRRAARDARNSSLYPGAPPRAFRLRDRHRGSSHRRTSARHPKCSTAFRGENLPGAPGSAKPPINPVESICFRNRRNCRPLTVYRFHYGNIRHLDQMPLSKGPKPAQRSSRAAGLEPFPKQQRPANTCPASLREQWVHFKRLGLGRLCSSRSTLGESPLCILAARRNCLSRTFDEFALGIAARRCGRRRRVGQQS